MIQTILTILAGVLSIYTLLCFVYILMSWFPGARFTKFGHVMTAICEPYMGLFRKLGFLRIGSIDFSPIVSIGILSLASAILAGIQRTGRIFFGGILGTILSSLWGIASSIIGIFTLLILIRWIVLLINKGRTSYDSGWNQVDMILNKMSYKIAGTFSKKNMSYQTSLLLSWIILLVTLGVGHFLILILVNLCYRMPF
ncbi:YggT family protein [Treponema bryantii]|uniref:YggT family protein n=1 Tax=Treponema bryantii TaxID=163 RepID=A0A1H9CC45_9SPIR|nr:YggT family protein [Treponema bryantii]BDC92495.1 membrane protein [Treponema bryantii]SEP98268.1 YggT family protein [Treponema bryantii]